MITVAQNQFADRDEAVALIRDTGWRMAEAQLSQADLTGAAHAHPYDVDIFLLEGVLELNDVEASTTHRLERGSRALVPAGTQHSESCPATFHAVFGLSVDPEPTMAERLREAGGTVS